MSDTSFIELPSDRNLVDMIKESMEHDKIKDMEYVDLLKEVILYLKTELSHKNEQLTTLIKSLNTNVEVGSKHDKLDIETMLENTQHQLNGTRNMECTNDRSMQHKVIINNKPSTCNEPTPSHFTLKDNHINTQMNH